MILPNPFGRTTESSPACRHTRTRTRRPLRPWGLESLENRVVLSTILTVTDTSDDPNDPNSLPHMVNEANTGAPGDVIEFGTSAFSVNSPGIISLQNTLSLINGESIQGSTTLAGANSVQIDGNQDCEPFLVESNDTISGVTIQDGADTFAGGIEDLSNLTITNTVIRDCTALSEVTTAGTNGGKGGGIFCEGGLTVTNCVFSNDRAQDGTLTSGKGGGVYVSPNDTASISNSTFNNDAASLGGGVYGEGIYSDAIHAYPGDLSLSFDSITGCTGGGVTTDGNSSITQCTIVGNSAASSSFSGVSFCGGVTNYGVAYLDQDVINQNSAPMGSGVSNLGTMTINATTISDNSAFNPGEGGGIYNDSSLTIESSTISNNVVNGSGGGIYETAATTGPLDTLYLIQCTIASNIALGGGGGVYIDGAPVTALNCTIAYNSSADPATGGGISIVGTTEIPLLTNTIVAENTDILGADNITGNVAQNSADNLIGTGASGGLTNGVSGNIVGVANPGLGTLASNGGPTQTIELAFGSPALNTGNVGTAIDPTTQDPLSVDQTGSPRIIDNTIDIGSVESDPGNPHLAGIHLYFPVSGLSMMLTRVSGDSYLTASRKHDLPFVDINTLQFDFQEPVDLTSADVMVASARGMDYGPITITGSGMDYTLSFAHPISEADRVTITITIAHDQVFLGQLDVLPGDVLDRGVVTSKDVTAIRRDLEGKDHLITIMYENLLGENTVNSGDLTAVKMYLGTKLPSVHTTKHPKPNLARSMVKRRPV